MLFVRRLDWLVGRLIDAAGWLVLPVIVLLFLQWPLRDLVHGYSRDANDLGQWIFALYVACSVTAATRAGTHLAADMLAQRYSARRRDQLRKLGVLFGLLPWALFVLIGGRNIVLSSLLALERFPDTDNPGYFIIKLALWAMAVLILAQAVIDLSRPSPKDAP
jgi:TRAP-type mannitol/chloroaromatic compound transport system permease small subunit